MKAIFVSDGHLSDTDFARHRIIIDALEDLSRDADMIFILGDLFEFFHGFHDHTYPFFRDIVDLLRKIASRKSVYFLEGNHEFGMGTFFETYTGVKCAETLAIKIDGKKVFLAHGDWLGFNPLRHVLKSRFTYSVMNLLGPDLTWKIAMASRPVLSKTLKGYNEKTFKLFRRFGEKKLKEGYDAVILAHSHMADMEKHDFGGRKGIYLNTGDLIESMTYGQYTSDEGFSLKVYSKDLPR
jgi:UDP-2,3-diacylglucosamine hydrolase